MALRRAALKAARLRRTVSSSANIVRPWLFLFRPDPPDRFMSASTLVPMTANIKARASPVADLLEAT
jgi:hypothetical protein